MYIMSTIQTFDWQKYTSCSFVGYSFYMYPWRKGNSEVLLALIMSLVSKHAVAMSSTEELFL